MNNTYECSYVEVLEILKHIPQNEYEKIPKEKLNFIKNIWINHINMNIILLRLKLQEKLMLSLLICIKTILLVMMREKKIDEKLMQNYQKAEIEKRKKYNPDNLFKNKKKI